MWIKFLLKITSKLSFITFFLLIFTTSAQAALELRVAIKKGVNNLQIGSSTPAVIKDSTRKTIGQVDGMNSFVAKPSGGKVSLAGWNSNSIWLEPSGDGVVWVGDRWYRGRVLLTRQGSGITAVNYVDMEDYLYSVVGAEAVPSWPQEALKAQAVAARTYALYKRNTSRNSVFDLDTTTATQVYKGLGSEYTTTHQAVQATNGQIMTYNNQPILAVFHSSSGGHTENVEDIWTSPLPYLRGVVDYDQTSPVFQWNKSVSLSSISRVVGGVGNIRELRAQKTTPQGRIITMQIVGDRSTKTVAGSDLRSALDLRSTLFRVSPSGNTLQVSGRGFGHGLGLSQWGTYYLAKNNVDYRQILGHYYQNARLATMKTR
ncbi:MAG: SpoIID/LytB domain-containing protein [Cyanobacteria bacterium]|nr:SpoIID/LytB domain-containing protein [Cyanobacteria bacterium CG_2015-16_32_12]NCO79095.1 SpoIID/LytB domain-containing protein [Cyanobacteria bacterium CG_2015-22_32_23]NCQ03841.1 SpoIID/LytB domain-containing protein [Cyanobacteria bacterium CG_2015-09_32_10]